MALTVTTENFTETVINAAQPVLLDFWAPWCGPCRQVGPVIEQLAEEFNGRAVVGKVNVDEETLLAEQFKVMSIPSLFVLVDGEVVERVVGARGAAELSGMLEKYVR